MIRSFVALPFGNDSGGARARARRDLVDLQPVGERPRSAEQARLARAEGVFDQTQLPPLSRHEATSAGVLWRGEAGAAGAGEAGDADPAHPSGTRLRLDADTASARDLLVCAYAARSRARASSRRSSAASRCCRSAISSRRATGRRLKTGSTRPVACRSNLARICTRRASRSLITRAPRWRKSAESPVASAKEMAEAACRRIQATQACVRRRRCLARRSPRAGIRSIDARTSWRRRPAVESAIGTAPFAETGLLERALFALTAIGSLPFSAQPSAPASPGQASPRQTKPLSEAEKA